MNKQELFKGLQNGILLMEKDEKIAAALMIASTLINSLVQTFALIGFVPFIQALIDPVKFANSKYVIWFNENIFFIESEKILFFIGISLIVIVIIKNIYGWYHLHWISLFSARCEVNITNKLMGRVLKSPYSWTITQNSLKIREIILGHCRNWSANFLHAILRIFNDGLFLIFLSSVLIIANPAIGIFITFFGIIIGLTFFLISKPALLKYTVSKRNAAIKSSQICVAAIIGSKEVKMTNAEKRFSEQFLGQIKEFTKSNVCHQKWQQLPRFALEAVGVSIILCVCLISIYNGISRPEITSILVLYALATIRIIPILSMTITNFNSLVTSIPLINEIQQMFMDSYTVENKKNKSELSKNWNTLILRNIRYCYKNSGQYALNRINELEIKKGYIYGLVGRSGAGKSTLADIIAGLLEPTSGELFTDSNKLNSNNYIEWREQIGYVAQTPFILDASLLENITFSDYSDINQEHLKQAIKSANLQEIIDSLPEGINTKIGEYGVLLSGGQRQRVAIARALYKQCNIIIFDEATSSLDNISEKEVIDTIISIKEISTIIFIAHRLDTVRNCDEIWVLDEGKIADIGNHEKLLEQSNIYNALINGKYKNDFLCLNTTTST